MVQEVGLGIEAPVLSRDFGRVWSRDFGRVWSLVEVRDFGRVWSLVEVRKLVKIGCLDRIGFWGNVFKLKLTCDTGYC